MTPRSKRGLILFIFVTAFSLAYASNYYIYFYSDSFFDFSRIRDSLLSYYSLYLFCTIIFSVGVAYTEKRIINNNFFYTSLLRYNFFLWFIIAAIFEAAIFILSRFLSFGSAESAGFFLMYGIIYAPVIALGITVIFSLIPSVIFYKIYNKIKLRRIIFYSVIILSATLFIFAVVRISETAIAVKKDSSEKCNRLRSYTCFAGEAYRKKDFLLCEKNKRELDRDYCYFELAESYRVQENVCLNIKDKGIFNRCITEIAIITKDLTLCNLIKEVDRDCGYSCTEYSLYDSAQQERDACVSQASRYK